MDAQFNTSSMHSPGGYGLSHASRSGSRDMAAFGDSRGTYRIGRVPRGGGGGAQPHKEHEAQGMGMPPQPGGPMQPCTHSGQGLHA